MSDEPGWDELLSTNAEDAVRPPPTPKGTYRAYVASQEPTTSPKKGTPGVEFVLTKLEPQSDVDPQKWQDYISHKAIVGTQIEKKETFWLTQKSLYRLAEFCEKCGAKRAGSTMKKMVNDAVGSTVLVSIDHTVAKDGESVYDNIVGFTADA